ncbi:50S ribosome-binding GTPase [Phormidium sp. CLA17]|uniref:GTPase family protein n=1 Tax=Leptolyngbya sp. Cla-17 TaxID=2803751 RepID=UPI0014911FC6|nr:GTPase [Leptolyngbya sp. Cla-17]MBM0740977.1 50S ribosome-binding GTPase [Leptolyngbya sp. Cla-17]
MVRLKLWQWAVLGLPIAGIVGFLLIASGVQIHTWGLSWIWAIFTLLLVGWRFLLVKWTRPAVDQIESVMAAVTEELKAASGDASTLTEGTGQQLETALQQILEAVQTDPPVWEDWSTFWQRCQELVTAIAQVYHPEVKRPLLNIYIPQAYTLIRGTVDDMDQWMGKLSPALNQMTVGQAVEGYEIYRRLEPSARKLLRVWNWAQWFLNPAVAIAKQATQRHGNQASQQLLVNLSQLLKQAALRNLSNQAISLYSGKLPGLESVAPTLTIPVAKTQTLQEILSQTQSLEKVEQKPVNILLVGRTGAGKSSLINTLFVEDKAAVDLLPSTEAIQDYHWQSTTGDALTLWDTPGYEQANRADFRDLVLDRAMQADVLLLVTPALDPALQMDVDFLTDVKAAIPDLPAIAAVTQVDKLRPIREWNPPYDWKLGELPKEIAIREATQYRAAQLHNCNWVLPVVTGNAQLNRTAWGIEALSLGLVDAIAPAKQLRLARFLRNLEARTIAAAKIIDRYTFQMTTTQGLTTLLKSPVLTFLATLTTGTPNLAYLLSEQIPIEQLPIVIGKLQMAYDLFSLLSADNPNARNFDLLALWSILLENTASPELNAWAFGHAITEYWTQSLTTEQLQQRFQHYLQEGEKL